MKIINEKGQAVYFNSIRKNGKDQWCIKGIGETVIYSRDRKPLKSRCFTQEHQARAYLKRHGFTTVV